MAGPVLHMVLALKVLSFLPDHDQKCFILGAMFPDIKHLDIVVPHLKSMRNVTWQDVKSEKNSFIAGMKFHELVVHARDGFVKDKKVLDFVPSSMFISHALKVNEDIVLHQYLHNCKLLDTYFETIIEDQKSLKIKDIYINTWHKALKHYLNNAMHKEHRFKFFKRCAKKRFRLSKDGYFYGAKKAMLLKTNQILFDNVEDLVEKIKDNQKVKALVLDFYNNFTMLIGAA